jgi:serine/threonine-protein kinase
MAVPARIGDYEVEGVLGEGGSAVVYAARGEAGEVALKVLRADAAVGEREIQRFLDEARHLARVVHPNLVRVQAAGTLPDGRPFLAMTRLRGETLAARLGRGPLALDEALRLFRPIVDAVAAIHEAGLLHRDLKPENVFLEAEGGRPVVLDLGIAREQGAATTTGLVRGTPATMAPERFFGAGASEATEVYELALLLYAMLTGRSPWGDAADVEARLHARPPHEIVKEIPEALSEAIMTALSTRAERRPRSAKELLASVEAAAHRTEDGGRRTDGAPILDAGRRNDTPSATVRDGRSAPSPPPAAPPARRRAAVLAVLAVVILGTRWWSSRASPPSLREPASSAAVAGAAPMPASASPASAAEPPAASASVAPTASDSAPLTASDSVAPTASASVPPKASASAPPAPAADPLAPCREIARLYCQPEQKKGEPHLCALAEMQVREVEQSSPSMRRALIEVCKQRLPRVREEVEVGLGRRVGRTFGGVVSDAELNAKFPGCARLRRLTCLHDGESSVTCLNLVRSIDRDARGSEQQQRDLRLHCDIDAAHERDIAAARRADAGVP